MFNYSISEKKEFRDGLFKDREDFYWCKGDKKKIKSCVESRKGMLNLSISRKDKNMIAFQKGYLSYFKNKGYK